MPIASLPIAVIMQRRTVHHQWAQDAWAAVAVVADSGALPLFASLRATPEREEYLVSGLRLELYRDEHDGYFENCIAPEPKVFVLWRMQGGRAVPVQVSVSYGEGTRMLDSGEAADGVAMPAEIHAWLERYLQQHYQPRSHRRGHHD